MAKVFGHYSKIHLLKCFRSLHVSVPNNGQAKMMKKIMGNSTKKKHKFIEAPLLPTPKMFAKGAFDGKRSSNSKRATVLNKLFMRYLTDLMSTGECSSEFVGHGIEIERVQITPDFNCVNVFWISKDHAKDETIENILKRNSGHLRHELAQLKIVGVIPRIQFIKDEHFAKAAKIDQILAVADFGDDYAPTDTATKLKTQLQLNMNLEPHVVEKISSLEAVSNGEQIIEEPLPPMPNNVFGLNHVEIMERIKKSKKKSLALHRLQSDNDSNTEELVSHSANKNPIQFASISEEREAFREFLRKRGILKNKVNRMEKNLRPELDYLEEEWLKNQRETFKDDFFDNKTDDQDFIEEDDNIK